MQRQSRMLAAMQILLRSEEGAKQGSNFRFSIQNGTAFRCTKNVDSIINGIDPAIIQRIPELDALSFCKTKCGSFNRLAPMK